MTRRADIRSVIVSGAALKYISSKTFRRAHFHLHWIPTRLFTSTTQSSQSSENSLVDWRVFSPLDLSWCLADWTLSCASEGWLVSILHSNCVVKTTFTIRLSRRKSLADCRVFSTLNRSRCPMLDGSGINRFSSHWTVLKTKLFRRNLHDNLLSEELRANESEPPNERCYTVEINWLLHWMIILLRISVRSATWLSWFSRSWTERWAENAWWDRRRKRDLNAAEQEWSSKPTFDEWVSSRWVSCYEGELMAHGMALTWRRFTTAEKLAEPQC
jgi:hypothetical protein